MEEDIPPEVRLYRHVDGNANVRAWLIRTWHWHVPAAGGDRVPEHAEIRFEAKDEQAAWRAFEAIASGARVAEVQLAAGGVRSYLGSDPPSLPAGALLEESRPISR